ncbi:hypothetical protein RSAG8_00465, partial [Rhizoctonia solani AG-8 WAC10335]
MALSTSRSCMTQLHINRGSGALRAVGRAFSLGTSLHESGSEESSHEPTPKRYSNPLLHVQTHTGVRNMAHGLHILRQIEKKFGAIESYLFPRESGTNEYHPAFFFRFRDPGSIRRLAKPFTHFDIPILSLEDKPNDAIGINDVSHLISPDSSEFSLVRGLELMRNETSNPVDTASEEDPASSDASTPSTLKSRYAVRVAVSGLPYQDILSHFFHTKSSTLGRSLAFNGSSKHGQDPQPFFSHKIINPREKPRIQRELETWKSAYEVLDSSVKPPSQSESLPKIQTIEELLQENFNVPQNTLVLPQRKHTQEPEREENNGPEHTGQPPQPTEYQLFKVHSRRSVRLVSGDPPHDSKISAEIPAESGSSAEGVVPDGTPTANSLMQPTPRFSAKRERQLEQMRRAAASQVRSIAEKRRVEEEAAKQPKTESEVDHIPTMKQELSLWDRFLKR